MKHLLPISLTVLTATIVLSGCSLQKMTGDTMVGYTEEHVFPYLMASDDVGMGCELGVSMGGFLMSFERVDVETAKAAVPSLISAGMCAESEAQENELRRMRALHEGRSNEAKDASLAEALAHESAARRNHLAFLETVRAYGDPNKECPEFDGTADQAIYMLGMSAGLLAVVHDRLSGVRANVPMDIPRQVERGAACLDDDKWWGMPSAIRAAIWLSIPGVTPEGEDPWAVLEAAAAKGDAAGVGMARGLYVQVASANGRTDLMCSGVEAFNASRENVERNKKWVLLDVYAGRLVRHETDKTWTRARGHRTPEDPATCFSEEPEDDDDDLGDDFLDDISGGEAPGAKPKEEPKAEPEAKDPGVSTGPDTIEAKPEPITQ